MPVQTQVSLAAKLGARLVQANAETMGKPLNLGRQRLPGGIRYGIARLQSLIIKEQEEDGRNGLKGMPYLSGSAVVVYPVMHAGIKVANLQTFFQIPLSDVPARGNMRASTLAENYDQFRSLLISLGAAECKETPQTDPTSEKTNLHWVAHMQALCNPQRPGGPVHVAFTTSDYKSKRRPGESDEDFKNREPMVIETWLGAADMSRMNGQPAPGSVNLVTTPAPNDRPPVTGPDGLPNVSQSRMQQVSAPAVTQQQIHSLAPEHEANGDGQEMSLEDEVTQLVAIATDDPQGKTEEGAAAGVRLRELAHANGWTEHQTGEGCDSWEDVGDMALRSPSEEDAPPTRTVVVGSRWKYSKRDSRGNKIVNGQGQPFAPLDVEVVTVDGDNCTLKTVKDGKMVLGVNRKTLVAKQEHLE